MTGNQGNAEIAIFSFPSIGVGVFIRQETLAQNTVQKPDILRFEWRFAPLNMALKPHFIDGLGEQLYWFRHPLSPLLKKPRQSLIFHQFTHPHQRQLIETYPFRHREKRCSLPLVLRRKPELSVYDFSHALSADVRFGNPFLGGFFLSVCKT
jgi:hypothetical protein